MVNNTGATLGTARVPQSRVRTSPVPTAQQHLAANAFTGVSGGTCLTATGAPNLGQGGPQLEALSLNKVPDVLAKAAYEALRSPTATSTSR